MAADLTTVTRMRAALVCGVSAALSIAAHAVAGGAAPDQAALVLLLGVAAVSGVLAADDRVPVPLLLVLGQITGHVVLGLEDGHLYTPGPMMTAAHIAAVAVAAALVQGAEKGCAVALAALHRMRPQLYRPLPVLVAPPTRTLHRPRVGRGVLLVGGTGSRAPPVVLR